MESAIDWAGCWLGVATSGPSVFRYHWCLEQNGNEIVGIISLSMPDGSRAGSVWQSAEAENRLDFDSRRGVFLN